MVFDLDVEERVQSLSILLNRFTGELLKAKGLEKILSILLNRFEALMEAVDDDLRSAFNSIE